MLLLPLLLLHLPPPAAPPCCFLAVFARMNPAVRLWSATGRKPLCCTQESSLPILAVSPLGGSSFFAGPAVRARHAPARRVRRNDPIPQPFPRVSTF